MCLSKGNVTSYVSTCCYVHVKVGQCFKRKFADETLNMEYQSVGLIRFMVAS